MVLFAGKLDKGVTGMIKRVLGMFAIVFALTIITGISVHASPSIIDVRANRTSVIQGASVTFTVYVSNETRFVWARSGITIETGTETAGTPLGVPAGTRVFNVTVTPTATGNVYILANTVNDMAYAATRPVLITVSGGQATQPGAVGGIQIIGIYETRATHPNTVQLTVVTGVQAGDVWVRFDEYPHNWRRGELQSESPASRIWTISYAPASFVPHRVQVGSNTTYTLAGASFQYFDVGLLAPYTPRLNPVIFGRTISTSNVNVGNSVTIRVNTNQDVYSVWVMDADGIESVARRIPPLVPETVRHFEVMVAPYRTGSLSVFAGAFVGDPNAVYITENVVVNVPNVYITQASITQVANSMHQEAIIRVTTNQNAGSVWAVLPDGETVRLSLVGQPGAQGNRTWEARPGGVATPNVTVRVSATLSNIPSVTQTLSNWGTAIAGGQVQPQVGISGIAPNAARRGSSVLIEFYVPDNVHQVVIVGTEGVLAPVTLPLASASGGRQRWGGTVVMPTGANITHVMLTVSTYVHGVRQDVAHHAITLTN